MQQNDLLKDATGVTIDSRKVKPGFVFIPCDGATEGSKSGQNFIDDAKRRGAKSIVTAVNKPRVMAAHLTEEFYGNPSSHLAVCAITGTSGKTTTSFLLEAIFRKMGTKAAVLGTLGCGATNSLKVLSHTTPEAEVLSEELAALRAQNYSHVFMEVSSHALATHRVDGLRFKVAAFTNLSQDHLDFHKNMAEYQKAKERLFVELLPKDSPAVVPVGSFLADLLKDRHPIITYGYGKDADVSIFPSPLEGEGPRVRGAHDKTLHLNIPTSPLIPLLHGETEILTSFNIENMLCAAACAYALGATAEQIVHGLSNAKSPPGRFEHVIANNADSVPTVIIDYSHKPEALERVLIAARSLTNKRLFVVFGCAGDRDKTKRPLMGSIAARLADFAFLAHDNPRHENPQTILDEVAAGFPTDGTSHCFVIGDRRTAISTAIHIARAGEVVVIAGKGPETTQQFGDLFLPFSDYDTAVDALEDYPS